MNNIKKDDFYFYKELTANREKYIKVTLKEYQDNVIEFCKNIANLQHKENFFILELEEQFEFNSCVERSSLKLQKDFQDIEKFYSQCKEICVKKDPDVLTNIQNYNNASLTMLRPNLNPCVKECVIIYEELMGKYYKYMIKDKGLYVELI
jgi:hypothetical protein